MILDDRFTAAQLIAETARLDKAAKVLAGTLHAWFMAAGRVYENGAFVGGQLKRRDDYAKLLALPAWRTVRVLTLPSHAMSPELVDVIRHASTNIRSLRAVPEHCTFATPRGGLDEVWFECKAFATGRAKTRRKLAADKRIAKITTLGLSCASDAVRAPFVASRLFDTIERLVVELVDPDSAKLVAEIVAGRGKNLRAVDLISKHECAIVTLRRDAPGPFRTVVLRNASPIPWDDSTACREYGYAIDIAAAARATSFVVDDPNPCKLSPTSAVELARKTTKANVAQLHVPWAVDAAPSWGTVFRLSVCGDLRPKAAEIERHFVEGLGQTYDAPGRKPPNFDRRRAGYPEFLELNHHELAAAIATDRPLDDIATWFARLVEIASEPSDATMIGENGDWDIPWLQLVGYRCTPALARKLQCAVIPANLRNSIVRLGATPDDVSLAQARRVARRGR